MAGDRDHWPLDEAATAALVDLALDEDIGSGDATVEATIPADLLWQASMVAREDMVIAGLPFAAASFWRLAPDMDINLHAMDGDRVGPGDKILSLHGQARAILTAERVALNMLQHLSGIATTTARYVAAMAHPTVKLLDTRKTIPGLRLLAKYATAQGGATNHRMGLYDAIMIKDNHIAAAGSLSKAVTKAKAGSRLAVQVECDTIHQVREALAAGADSLLLDNMSTDQLREAVKIVAGRIPTEASGGVSLDSISAIAQTGVDAISVGRLTQSAPAVDIGLDYLNS